MTDNKMTAEQALEAVRNVLQRAYNSAEPVCCGLAYTECCGSPEPEWSEYDQQIMNYLQPVEEYLSQALSAPRVPVAWMVTRDRDQSFPRLYVEKALAERVVSFVEVNPPAVLHPLYTLAASPEPVAIERDSGTLTVEADGGVSKIVPKRYEETESAGGVTAEDLMLKLDSALYRIMVGEKENGDITFIRSACKAWAESEAAEGDLRAEVEALRVDAYRYRWIRDGGWMLIGEDRGNGPEWPDAIGVDHQVDAAIDKARLREGGDS